MKVNGGAWPLAGTAPARVLVAGDVMLDQYWSGSTTRVSQEAPVPIVAVSGSEARAGGAANVACNAAALGAQVRLLGVVGADEPAQLLAQCLRAAGVEAALSEAPGLATTRKLRILSRNQQVLRLDFGERVTRAHGSALAQVQERYVAALDWADVVILSDYDKGVLARADRLIAAARRAGKPVLVDPKGLRYGRYRCATVLKPNLAEFAAVAGPCSSVAALTRRAQALCQRYALGALVITRGEAGLSVVQPGRAALHLPTAARDVYDVTGAGDTVIATLAVALGWGLPLSRAARLANLAAKIAVGRLGTTAVTLAELQRELAPPRRAGIVDAGTLALRLAEARAQDQTVVMTNGCFDLLHAGHVRYLQQARRLGDVLVVAVNDDASVRRLKGPGRPLNPLAARMAVLAELGCVDWVVPFAADTPAALVERLQPDVLVKGGDYRPQEIAGAGFVEAHGGRVCVLPYRNGYSSSALIERARASA